MLTEKSESNGREIQHQSQRLLSKSHMEQMKAENSPCDHSTVFTAAEIEFRRKFGRKRTGRNLRQSFGSHNKIYVNKDLLQYYRNNLKGLPQLCAS